MVSQRKRNIPKATNMGKNLKFLRRIEGLSQTDFAKRVGLKRNNIASYESGMVEPSGVKFLEICDYFEISPSEMLEKVFDEHPDELISPEQTTNAIDTIQQEEIEEFIAQTNEMTKIFEGYKSFLLLKKEQNQHLPDTYLDSVLDDLLTLFKTLLMDNWEIINALHPDEEE